MSTWTIDEVNALSMEHQGGNEVALHVWLANAPPIGGKYPGGSRPKEGDRVEVFKQFITDCYELKKFRASTPFTSSTSQHQPPIDIDREIESKLKNVKQLSPLKTHSSNANISSPPRSVALPVPEVDLLAFDTAEVEQPSFSVDFGAFEGGGQSNHFDAFGSNGHLAPLSTSAPKERSNSFLNFGEFTGSLPSVPPVVSSNHFFPSGQSPPIPSYNSSVDPFASNSLKSSIPMPSSSNNGSNNYFSSGQPAANNNSVDPFSQTLHASVSMPLFPTAALPLQTPNLGPSQSQRSHVKSNLDLLSLFDQQPHHHSNTSSQIQSQTPLKIDSSNAISDMGNSHTNMKYSSGPNGYNQAQSSSSSMNSYTSAHGINQMGSNNISLTGGVGQQGQGAGNYSMGYQPQYQLQQHQQQQYQPQQRQQQTQPNHQLPYRGIVNQQNVSKAPVDSFGFVESVLTSQVHPNGVNSSPNLSNGSQHRTY
jgi:hypothetical protein